MVIPVFALCFKGGAVLKCFFFLHPAYIRCWFSFLFKIESFETWDSVCTGQSHVNMFICTMEVRLHTKGV